MRNVQPFQIRHTTRQDFSVAMGMVTIAIIAMFDVWRDIFRVGYVDEELSYVLLAPLIIGWLVWVRRDRWKQARVSAGWMGLGLIAIGWLVYWYGFNFDPVLWRAGAVLVAAATIVAALGMDVVKKFAPAMVACVFLIPVDPTGRYHIAGPMEAVTAQVTQEVCNLLGIYVERAGNLLSINGADVTIAEACNGMRMVFTLFMVCYVVAFTFPLQWYLRVFLLVASPLIAIVSNVVRLVPTVWMFGHASLAAAERFHAVSGWVMSILAFLVLMGFCKILQRFFDEGKQVETAQGVAS